MVKVEVEGMVVGWGFNWLIWERVSRVEET